MGMTAQEFMKFKDTHSDAELKSFFDSLLFKEMNIMVKAKYEYYNGEQKLKFFAAKVQPRNAELENKALLNRLSIYEKKEEGGETQN